MTFLRRHPLALVVIVGLLAGGLAIAVAQAPDDERPQDFHGRTWLTASAKSGDQLVLVNGISGLIEGRSQGGATIPDGARFIDSTTTSTLVGSSKGATVVRTGTQQAITKEGVDATHSVLSDDFVLTLGKDVRVLPTSLEGAAHRVNGPAPVADVDPVVDGSGAAWYLGRKGNERMAVRVTGPGGSEVETHAVDRSTDDLLVVDGNLYAAGPKAIDRVDGSGSRTVAASSDVLPSVAIASGTRWASAAGRTVTLFDGKKEHNVRTRSTVVALAVWHGDVIAATKRGAERVGTARSEPIKSIRSQAAIHADGGMLWLTSEGDVVAIDRDQQESHFRLAAMDADLCVQSCDPGDVSKFLKHEPKPDTGQSTTTTAPPRDLQSPDTEPELPTTTTTTTPTTTTEAPATETTIERSPRNTTTTTAPKPTTTAKKPPTTVRPLPTNPTLPPPQTRPTFRPPQTRPTFRPPQTRPTLPPPQTRPTFPSTQPPRTNPPVTPPTNPPWTPPTNPPWTRPPHKTTTTTTSTTAPATTTTTQPVKYNLSLSVATSEGSATASVQVIGPARPCAPFGNAAAGTVRWSGTAGSGSQQVAMSWNGDDDRSQPQAVTIPNLVTGGLDVTFEACGVVTSPPTHAEIQGASPVLGEIQLPSTPPKANSTFQASAQITLPAGWSIQSGNWNGSGDGSPCTVPDAVTVWGPTSTTTTFNTHQAGRCNVTLVVTFAGPNGLTDKQNRAGGINVVTTASPGGGAAPASATGQTPATEPKS